MSDETTPRRSIGLTPHISILYKTPHLASPRTPVFSTTDFNYTSNCES